MRVRFLLVFLLPLVLLDGCGGDVVVPYERAAGFDALGEAGVQALRSFEQQCPAVVKGVGDLDFIRASPGTVMPKTPDYGWNKGVTVEFQVKTALASAELAPAAGHVCTFEMGGGFRPGMFTTKSTCAAVCGVPEAGFVDLPALSVIESQAAAAEAEAKRVADGAGRLAELEKKALAGDYQAQRNYAYSLATGDGGAPYEPVKACAWYAYITVSGSPKVDETDQGNVRVYCGRLTDEQRQQAQVLAEQVLATVRGG